MCYGHCPLSVHLLFAPAIASALQARRICGLVPSRAQQPSWFKGESLGSSSLHFEGDEQPQEMSLTPGPGDEPDPYLSSAFHSLPPPAWPRMTR